ncbi:MAG: type II secretion system protein GspG [bacterium]|nr:type II secretion system protein GspG [bacterium]MBU1917003.1 type II secretion system protein GspG [bacterium]
MLKMMKTLQNSKGMSLMEILVVLGIIAGATAAIVGAVSSKADKARIKQAETEISGYVGDIKQYKIDERKYPSTDEGLEALVDAGFREEIRADPWGNDYTYESPGSHGKKFEICSDGPDEETEEDDICNYKKSDE